MTILTSPFKKSSRHLLTGKTALPRVSAAEKEQQGGAAARWEVLLGEDSGGRTGGQRGGGQGCIPPVLPSSQRELMKTEPRVAPTEESR